MHEFYGPETPREPDLADRYAAGVDYQLRPIYECLEENMQFLADETDPANIRLVIYPLLQVTFNLKDEIARQQARKERAARRAARRTGQ